jgi:hypothetical protein
MGNSHSITKRKRRHKSGHRKDTTAATMSKLKQLELKQPNLRANFVSARDSSPDTSKVAAK